MGKTAMESVLDPDTGRLTTYRSYADQMAKEMGAIKKLEKSGGDEEAIQKKKDSVARFKENGYKPSAGVLVFDQIDVDGSGAIDRGELQTLLNKLPRKKPAPGVEFVPFEDMIKTFDADGNGTIELDEWLNNLQKLPGIRMAIESVMDFDTGMLTVDLQQAEEEQLRALSHQKLRTFVRCSEFRTQNPFPVRWGDFFFILHFSSSKRAHQYVWTSSKRANLYVRSV